MKCALLLCFVFAVSSIEAGLVPFIEPCLYNDSACILKSAKKAMPHVVSGLPDIGVPSLDPLILNDVNGDNGELKLKFKKITVTNLKSCEIIKVERPTPLKLNVEMNCPILASGHYVLGGKLFVIDVEGDDEFEIKADKMKITVSANIKLIKKDGVEYYKLTGFDFSYDPLDKVFYNFHNLFHGDKAKAEPINAILNESWKEIILDIGKPVMKEIITQVVQGFAKLFQNVPRTELEIVN